MNDYKETGSTTIDSSDDSMLTFDENDGSESESDYSVSSEILLPRGNKRNDRFNRTEETRIEPVAHSSKESNCIFINYALTGKLLTTQLDTIANDTIEEKDQGNNLKKKIYYNTKVIVPDTSNKYKNLQNVELDSNRQQNDKLLQRDVKNSLIKNISDFDKWISKTFLSQVETLKENDQDYIQCWNRFNAFRRKVNTICNKHTKQDSKQDTKQTEKKVIVKESLSNFLSNIQKNDTLNEGIVRTSSKRNEYVNKNSDLNVSKTLSVTPEIYYPQAIMKQIVQIEGEIGFKTIQFLIESTYQCLLCKVKITGKNNVFLHVGGKCHKDNLKKKELVELLITYHDIWNQFTSDVQLHQVYFWPGKEKFVNCLICNTIIYPQNIIEHVAGRIHTEKLTAQGGPLWQTKLSRSNSVSSVSSTATQNSKSNNKKKIKKSYIKTSNTVKIVENNVSIDNLLKNLKKKPELKKETELIAQLSEVMKNKLKLKNKVDNGYEHNANESDGNKNNEGSSLKVSSNKKDIWNNIPERLYFNKKVIKVVDTDLLCEFCNNILVYNSVDLLKHLTSKQHEDLLKKAPPRGYNEFIYYCTMCTKTFGSENKWQNHLLESSHVENCKSIQNNSKFKMALKEQMCKKCKNVVLFGDDHATLLHNHHASMKKKKDFKLPSSIQKLYSSITDLELHSENLLRVAESVLLQDSKDIECCQALAQSLQKEFPGCVGYRFGSRVSGLGNEYSDLDVFLDTGNMYNGLRNQDPKIQANLVRITFRALWKNFQWDGIEPIPLARTPIIRAYHKPSDLDCDISFKHGLSVENTKLLSLYMNMQPITRRMILSLKYWSQECQFHFKISSYAISLLAIFYLQTKQYLYSVVELRNMYKGPMKSIAGWDCTFFDDIGKIEIKPCLLSLPELLQDFFKFCAEYKFEIMVVCPLIGESVPKNDFHNGNGINLPKEMKQYVDKLQRTDFDCEVFRSQSPMCIQDPFDLSHNLTKASTQNVVTKFKSACNICYKLLEQQTSKLKNKSK